MRVGAAWRQPSVSRLFSTKLPDSVDAEQDYHKIGDTTLEKINDFLSPLEDDEETELEMSMGVLKLRLKGSPISSMETFRNQYITWVINKQTPNRQMWWSSPISGPRRYEWVPSATTDGLQIVSNWKYSRAINHPSSTNGAGGKGSEGVAKKNEGPKAEPDLLQQLHSEVLAVKGVDLHSEWKDNH
jgi:frataxin-like iron-binding protein CyaY